jgi:poly(A) polymerase
MTHGRKRTGREAVNRIVWDNRLAQEAFVVGYVDRVAEGGVREKPLSAWDDGGEIPAHRISYIRCGEIIVWSRGDESDRLADLDLPRDAWVGAPPGG